jgi:KEOPS complex subunit Cgi121
MLKRIDEYGKYVEINSFRNVKVEDTKDFLKSLRVDIVDDYEVQLYNADLIATWQHLYFAALNALTAFRTNRNISKTLSVETVLYASGQRQIKKAIDLIGVKPDSTNVAIMLISENEESTKVGLSAVSKQIGADIDETVLDLSETKNRNLQNAFDISEGELDASGQRNFEQRLVDLIIERVALLSTRL